MGTHWGVVHIMDFEGNENQKFQAHTATVNDLSVDLEGEFIASASDDGMLHKLHDVRVSACLM
jgi:WD40 repeat protein